MERPRSARLARGTLLWAALVLPALTADRIGLNEPRTLWQQAAGAAVLAAAAALSRRLPLATFGLTATLSLTYAPSLFTASYGPALGTSALLLGLRAGRARSGPRMVVVTPVAPAEPGDDPTEEQRARPGWRTSNSSPVPRSPGSKCAGSSPLTNVTWRPSGTPVAVTATERAADAPA
ncbi:hypothetical protein ACFC4C_18935 [Streptomyces sp. NPDC056039]|uniref:hypothetical protein n=1 Tax=Streptomyces sp. NPDC056039 TaxID=3345687 RepID=UPI0035E07953